MWFIYFQGEMVLPKSTDEIVFQGFRRAHKYSGAVVKEQAHGENTASFAYIIIIMVYF